MNKMTSGESGVGRLEFLRTVMFALLVPLLPLLFPQTSRSDTHTVLNTNDSGAGSLRQVVVTDASAGDTVQFDSSLSGATITLTSGQITINKSLTIDGSSLSSPLTISGNSSSRVFYISDTWPAATVNITKLKFINGRVTTDSPGGGAIFIYMDTNVNITNCTFNNNVNAYANTNYGYGGAIDIDRSGTIAITGCTFSNNSAGSGGAVSSYVPAQLTIRTSTFAGNASTTTFATWSGGAFFQNGAATTTLEHVTISGNTAVRGGGIGIYSRGSSTTIQLKNCLIANNAASTGGNDIYSDSAANVITSQNYNLIKNTTIVNGSISMAANDITGTDPTLGVLASNGGPTQTMSITTGSAALDTIPNGTNGCGTTYTTDQRGVPRPYNSACDMGSYEWSGATLVDLVSFKASWENSSMLLSWETATETDTAGFHLWRARSADAEYTQISGGLIASEGGPTQGAQYTFLDQDVVWGETYFYKLEDIDFSGTSTFHGPISANAAGFSIALRSPLNDTPFRRRTPPTTFQWADTGLDHFRIQFSSGPGFGPGTITLPLSKKGGASWVRGNTYTPAATEWNRVAQLGWNRKSRIYWRVYGTDGSGHTIVSETFRLQPR